MTPHQAIATEKALRDLIYAVKFGKKQDRLDAVAAAELVICEVLGEPARSAAEAAKDEAEAKAERTAAAQDDEG